MPPNSEIEKLERRWKENPKGTVFAPYAEVLRKHGDHLLARDVLRQGLELHPDHIPGNIVLGRCCLDLKEDGPAEAAFIHVLDLDQENVIALKALADITERQGRLMEAASWLSRLISVDPSNDEARDQLARVDSAREAAGAAMTAPLTHAEGQAPAPSRLEDITEALPLVSRNAPPPAATEVPTVEVPAEKVQVLEDADAQVDAHFSQFDVPLARTVPMGLPALTPEPPTELALTALPTSTSPEPDRVELMDLHEVTAAEAAEPPADSAAELAASAELGGDRAESAEVYAIGETDSGPIDLRPSSATEFQTPDDSLALLDLAPSGSEFQVSDASNELSLSSAGGTEYQTPSGADELLHSAARASEPEPVADVELAPEPALALDDEPAPLSKVVTTGFAAITIMPTQELPTEPPDEPLEMVDADPEPTVAEMPESEAESMRAELEPEPLEPTSSLVDMLAEAGTAAEPGESVALVEYEPATTLPEPVEHDHDLKLIFPDDTATPEAPRRRISEETAASVEPAATESGLMEPAPVLTESMAELYVRQGHLAEAINVYQLLAARSPNELRLHQRVAELQSMLAAGSRRLSYVAMETGGESVESFFRSLADARPAGSPPSRAMVEDEQGGGAPTRPANDPLSLSAIFGEDAASASTVSAVGEIPSKPPAPDAFSFDQFFGAASPGGSGGAPGGSRPQGEDLDQFQHWLKSLKK